MISSNPQQHFYTIENPSNQLYDSCSFASYYSPNTYHQSKRVKLDTPQFTFDVPSAYDVPQLSQHTSPSMPAQTVSRPRQLAHINLQRPSEPPSPATISSTLSTHSTPSPSPFRAPVHILGEGSQDFPLYEDYSIGEPQLKQANGRIQRYRPTNTSNPLPLNQQPWQNYSESQPIEFSKVLPSNHQTYFDNGFNIPRQLLQQTVAAIDGDSEPPALSPSRPTHMSSSSRHSISEHDTPPTPRHSNEHYSHGPANREDYYFPSAIVNWLDECLPSEPLEATHNGPKLMRTVSDAVQDELYNPGIAPGTAHSSAEQAPSNVASQFPSIFQQAQSQHAMARSSAAQQQQLLRDHSPFRANSPLHPSRTQAEMTSPATATFFPNFNQSARAQREREQQQQAQALKAQMEKEYEEMRQAPKTISPKDAYLEYHADEPNGVNGSLFASQSSHDETGSQHSTASGSYHSSLGDEEDIKIEPDYDLHNGRRNSDAMNYGMQYNYVNHQQPQQHIQYPSWPADHHSSQEYSDHHVYERPDDTSASSGAYSCTVHGCPLRFPTASKMSKHRREAHRHTTPMGGHLSVRAQHAGPHKCTRINPTTGKPCNTIFSRPYDLTRHEDTIHNTQRQKVRCEICGDEKTFSRYDALTRHKKVKHGIDK